MISDSSDALDIGMRINLLDGVQRRSGDPTARSVPTVTGDVAGKMTTPLEEWSDIIGEFIAAVIARERGECVEAA